jgi:hypothetical protein
MTDFSALGRLLIGLGILLTLLGLLIAFADRLPSPLGRLPGDILIRGKHFTFYFPLTTMLLLSLLATLVLSLLLRR